MSFIWFTNAHGVIGIAEVMNEYGETNYYISAVSGLDVEIDKQTVISWGAKFPDVAGALLFGEAKKQEERQAKNLFYKKTMGGGT